ncbi:MAG: hypothetical protein C4562_02660 [Actinobacteria bacterium]|nr:MAG: hypothetical protein C4562_02660 [Actinomycetota bacterium]
MKKYFLVAILVLIFTMVTTLAAYASNGVHEGPGYAQTTDKCAACHRGHTGKTQRLLSRSGTVYQFCTFCHNGTGANTNVVDGSFSGNYTAWGTAADGEAGAGLNGGGYQNAFYYTGRGGRRSGYGSIANDGMRHNATGSDTDIYTAWGSGNTGPGLTMLLTCTSCHDPHGTNNPDGTDDSTVDGTERYRILKNRVNGQDLDVIIKSNEIDAFGRHDYTKDAYQTGTSQFCASCHNQYVIAKGTIRGGTSGKYDSGDGLGSKVRYRHKVGIYIAGDEYTGNGRDMVDVLNDGVKLPLEQEEYNSNIQGNDSTACLTCHQAHGSTSTMGNLAAAGPANNPANFPSGFVKSNTLLRLNNRGICEDCHIR